MSDLVERPDCSFSRADCYSVFLTVFSKQSEQKSNHVQHCKGKESI